MGTFLCQVSERDWSICRRLGIYGNRSGDSDVVKFSIIRDLIGMKKGDNVIFHVVKKSSGESTIHGVYQVLKEPFYDNSKLWNDDTENFPYRFLFEPHKLFRQICKFDSNIEVTDFYELIEKKKIWSQSTLENEINIEGRSIRKIEAISELIEIIKYLYRDFNKNKNSKIIEFTPISSPPNAISLRNCLKGIGRLENSIKALVLYNIANNNFDFFPNIIDFMNEVLITSTYRKSIDIVCIQEISTNKKNYILFEVKSQKCDKKSLKQLLYYVDLFRQKDIFNKKNISVSGCLLGKSFDKDVVNYVRSKNKLDLNSNLNLLRYIPNYEGDDAEFEKII